MYTINYTRKNSDTTEMVKFRYLDQFRYWLYSQCAPNIKKLINYDSCITENAENTPINIDNDKITENFYIIRRNIADKETVFFGVTDMQDGTNDLVQIHLVRDDLNIIYSDGLLTLGKTHIAKAFEEFIVNSVIGNNAATYDYTTERPLTPSFGEIPALVTGSRVIVPSPFANGELESHMLAAAEAFSNVKKESENKDE